MTHTPEEVAAAAKRRSDWLASLQMLPEHRANDPYGNDRGIGNLRISDSMILADAYLATMPQWLPAGSLPDAEGWWLVCIDGDVWPINVRVGKDVFVMCGDVPVYIESVYRGCRFARLVMPAVPSDGGEA